MAHTTSRLGIDVVDGGDNVSAYPAANAQAMGVLDNAAIFLSGTLVSRPAASIQGRYYLATDDTSSGSSIGTLYFDTGAAWVTGFNPPSRGTANIATSQSTSSASYTTLATPDQVAGVVLPTNGLIQVWYQATWQESIASAAQANIFLNNVAVKRQISGATNPTNTYAFINHAAVDVILASYSGGLSSLQGASFSGAYGGDATTGQVVGGGAAMGTVNIPSGTGTFGFYGPCWIFAAPCTYTVSVQFLVSSGTVTVKNRQLWVQALSFA